MPMPLAIFLVATMVSVFSFISINTFVDQRRRERDAFYRNELFKKLAESPADQAQRVLDLMREKDLAAERRRREGTKLGGLIVTAVGFGLITNGSISGITAPVIVVGRESEGVREVFVRLDREHLAVLARARR